jgi:universal stress protein A
VILENVAMNDYTHVLAVVDLSASAEQILLKARDITQRNNATLSLLHVVEYLPPIDYENFPMYSNWAVDDEQMLTNARQLLEKLCQQHQLTNANVEVVSGTPKHEISQYVKQHQCDLVVMGSHGRHGINLLLGSTANAVLHAMPCDILTVKIKE